MKKFTRDDTEHGKEYYLASDVDALMAQPEQEPVGKLQEPVAWGVDWGKDGNSVSIIKRLADGNIEVLAWEYAPYTPQRPWVGLTDEEVFLVLENLQAIYNRPPTEDSRIIFARAIEAKLKEKNFD
jgi:hypothetical protein